MATNPAVGTVAPPAPARGQFWNSVAAQPHDPEQLLDDNGQPIGDGEPALFDDNGRPMGHAYEALKDSNSVASQATLSIRNSRMSGMLPPSPPPELPALRGFFEGMGRGAMSTGTQVGKFVRGATTGDFGPYSDPAVEAELHDPNSPTSIDPSGGAQTVGFYGEKLAELLAPAGIVGRAGRAIAAGGDLVAPSGRVLAELPAITGRLGRAALGAGLEGASNAAVTGIQTGDPSAAGWAGATGALTALPLKYWAKAERVKALIGKIVDPALAKPGAEAGMLIQQGLADAHDAAGAALGKEYTRVITTAAAHGNPIIALDKPGLAEAQRLLAELEGGVKNVPGLGSIDDVNKARGILQDMIAEAKGGQGVPIADAIKRRTFLRDIASSPIFQTSTGKGALQRLTAAWHGSMTSALDAAAPGLGQRFARASAHYAQFINTFESGTIKALVKAKAPDALLDALMSKNAETTATNLRKLIPAQDMEMVRSSLWKRLLERSSPGDSTFLAPKFDAALDKLSPEAQRAVFGSTENVIRMRKFASMMDTGWMHTAAKESLTRIAVRAGTGAAAGIGADRVLEHDGAGGWKVWGPAGAAMALAPALVAKVLARPGTIDVLERAMTTSPGSAAGKALASKVASLVMGAEMRGGDGGKQVQGGAPDVKGVLSTLEQGDAARRARAGAASAMVGGPPMPPPPPPSAGAQPQNSPVHESEPGMVAYIPRPLENDSLVQTTPPRDYLPERFQKARSARMGTPVRVGATDAPGTATPENKGFGAAWDGLSGRDFLPPHTDDRTKNNTILISRSNFEDHHFGDYPNSKKTMWARTLTHEVGHAVWQDLTPKERARWETLHKNFADYEPGTEDEHDSNSTKAMYKYGDDPTHSFAEQWAHYVVRPSELRAENPEIYSFMKRIAGGKEYIRTKAKK